jgi:hypothetical protein
MDDKHPRILMFSPLCYPPAGAEAIVTSKLVLAMIDTGWKVKVIAQSNFGHFYPTTDNDNWKPLLSVVDNISGMSDKGFMAHILGPALTNKLRTLLWVIKAIFAGLIALRKERYDVLLSRAAPQYGHLPALIVSRITSVPWIANWSDPMPPQKSPPPYGGGIHAKVSFFLNMYCRAVFRYADWHTFPCERLMKYYWQMAPELEGKSSVIPHIAFRKFCISQNQEKNIFSLYHTGSIALRDPSVFFEGLKRFLKDFKPTKKVKVFFIGDSVDEIRAKTHESGVGDIVWTEAPKTYEETQSRAASSSVLFVIEAKCDEGIFFPSKFVDFIQTGRPVLAISPRVGTLSDILSKNGGGIAVDNRFPDEISFALNKFYTTWEKETLETTYGSHKLLNYFCEDIVISKYSDIFFQLRRRMRGN